MKKLLTSFLLIISISSFAQTGIGTTTPNANARLEVSASDKGFLPPRVALTSTTAFAPLAAHVAGMVVYNTATANDVVPGLYTNNGSSWNLLITPDGIVTNVSGTVAIANGGTGATTKATAFDALSPITGAGDIMYGGVSGTGTALTAGAAGQVLTMNAGATAPGWATSTANQWTNNISDIYFNTGYVGIGTATPVSKLHIIGDIRTGNGNRVIFPASDASNLMNIDNQSGNLRIFREDLDATNGVTIMSIANNSDITMVGNLTSSLFSGTGDTDGGMYSNADGTLNFKTNNVEVVRFTDRISSNGGYSFLSGDIDGGMFSPADGTITFKTDNTERMRLTNDGLGIGTTPNTDAKLEISSTNKGFLPPRLALTSTITASPLASHVVGMTVYNTATVNDVIPGLYVNNGAAWVKQVGATSINGLSDGKAYNYSVFLGAASGSTSTGDYNTGVGHSALAGNTTGANNTAIGVNAGALLQSGGSNQNSINSVFIGRDSRANAINGTNEIVIGNDAIGNGTNTVTLGSTSITRTHLQGNVRLGEDKRIILANPSGGVTDMWNIDNSDGELRIFRENYNATGAGIFGDVAISISDNTGNKTLNAQNIYPFIDNRYFLGTPSLRWSKVFSANGVVTTSDKRKKTAIIDLPQNVIKAISQLRPVEYRWKENENGKHIGFIAQEVEQVFKDSGLNPADYFVIQHDAETDIYGLVYTEFIAAVLAYTQNVEKDLNDLKALLKAKGIID